MDCLQFIYLFIFNVICTRERWENKGKVEVGGSWVVGVPNFDSLVIRLELSLVNVDMVVHYSYNTSSFIGGFNYSFWSS